MHSDRNPSPAPKALLVTEPAQDHPSQTDQPDQPAILHVCRREPIRMVRDELLRRSGYQVDSTHMVAEALSMFPARPYALVLIDVEGDNAVVEADQLCSDVKAVRAEQLVAFVCNWRVAILSECADEVLRTEFDPAGFVAGVQQVLAKH